MEKLSWAVKNGDLEHVKSMAENEAFDVNALVEGRALIHYAADYGQRDVLAYLIGLGADLNLVDKHGISALLAAIWEGHTDCVQLMLEKGATRTGTTPDGTSYLDAAEKAEIKQLLA